MIEIQGKIGSKIRTIRLPESATVAEMLQAISKHTKTPERVRITAIRQTAGYQVGQQYFAIEYSASALCTGMQCDVVGCGTLFRNGDTVHHAVQLDGGSQAGAVICSRCAQRANKC